MKFTLALSMMVGSAAAFTAPSFVGRNTALNSAVASDVFTFEKSEEIFEEAKTVSSTFSRENSQWILELDVFLFDNNFAMDILFRHIHFY